VQRCVDAARGNIVLIRDCLVAYPTLRNWTHLYYYMLSASLVFIDRLNQAPFDQRALDYTRCCALATEAFEWMRPLVGTGMRRCSNSILTEDKIVIIIKNCLDEWKKRRDAKQNSSGANLKKQADSGSAAQDSDSDISDSEVGRTQDSPDPLRARTQPPADTPGSARSGSSLNSPAQTVFVPRKPVVSRDESFFGGQYLHYHSSENPNPTFINFPPDIYLANSVSFNHGNAITLMPTSPYEPLSALLASDMAPTVHQTSTSQIKVTGARSMENLNRIQGAQGIPPTSRPDEEEHVGGYTYNPSERIERMFGISPPWR
jgi:hypothetical protein